MKDGVRDHNSHKSGNLLGVTDPITEYSLNPLVVVASLLVQAQQKQYILVHASNTVSVD